MYHPTITHHFALEPHSGAYETWPATSRLVVNGVGRSAAVPGYALLHQFEIPDGFLLVTDFDCPFEEATCFTLVSKAMEVLATCSVGGMYASFLLDALSWIEARHLIATFHERDNWHIRILPPDAWFQHWRMTARRQWQ
jgi:hypothetical protein